MKYFKKRKLVFPPKNDESMSGVFGYNCEGLTLDSDIVSSTEMTGAVPAARDEYEDDAVEDYVFN